MYSYVPSPGTHNRGHCPIRPRIRPFRNGQTRFTEWAARESQDCRFFVHNDSQFHTKSCTVVLSKHSMLEIFREDDHPFHFSHYEFDVCTWDVESWKKLRYQKASRFDFGLTTHAPTSNFDDLFASILLPPCEDDHVQTWIATRFALRTRYSRPLLP